MVIRHLLSTTETPGGKKKEGSRAPCPPCNPKKTFRMLFCPDSLSRTMDFNISSCYPLCLGSILISSIRELSWVFMNSTFSSVLELATQQKASAFSHMPAPHSALRADLQDVPQLQERAVATVFPLLWCFPLVQGARNASGTQHSTREVWLLCCHQLKRFSHRHCLPQRQAACNITHLLIKYCNILHTAM